MLKPGPRCAGVAVPNPTHKAKQKTSSFDEVFCLAILKYQKSRFNPLYLIFFTVIMKRKCVANALHD